MKNTLLFTFVSLLALLSNHNLVFAQAVPDFVVNEFVIVDCTEQSTPSIDGDGNGSYVVTWMDERNSWEFDIYAQIYLNDSTPFGDNFKVNDDSGFAAQYNPSIAVDPNLNFVITWIDRRDGQPWDIYAQRFSGNGTALGNNFMVNNESGDEEQVHPAVAIDSSGNFVIVWSDEKSGDWDIYGQRYSADGNALDSNFRINDDTGGSTQYWPKVSSHKNGNFVVCWGDERNEDWDIYAQRFLADGTALGNNVKVNTDVGNSNQIQSDISFDGASNYIITWEDHRNGEWDIYAQQYLEDGTLLGENFNLNENISGSDQKDPSISSDLDGNFTICWEDTRFEYAVIYARQFSNNGTPLGDEFKVSDSIAENYQYYGDISSDNEGNFLIVWVDHKIEFTNDIFAQFYLYDGTTVDDNFKVNDDVGSANQVEPSLATDGSDNFIIAWIDNRNGHTDIYAQRFSGDGAALGNNFKVNDESSYYEMYYGPSIATDASGNFVIAWDDFRNEYWGDIYAQRFSSDGTPMGTNFKVNDALSVVYGATVACKKNGDFIICWGDAEDGGMDRFDFQHLNECNGLKYSSLADNKDDKPNIWAQQYMSDGTPQGANFKVNDDVGNAYQMCPAIVVDTSGNFTILWDDNRNGDWGIYAQRYLSDGTPQDNNIKILDSLVVDYQWVPSASSDNAGNLIVAWQDKRNGDYDIWAQRYLNDFTPVGFNFLVNNDGVGFNQASPCISADGNGDFIISWTDNRNDNKDVYAQRYLSNGQPLGSNYRVTNTSELEQYSSSVILSNNRIFTTWQDNRDGQTGFDIWANVMDWDSWVGIENNKSTEVSSLPCLHQNYPNPFRSSTTIKFDLPNATKVRIEIFNYFGQRVETLLNKSLAPGTHQIEFYAADLPGGVYLVRMAADSFGELTGFKEVRMDFPMILCH